MGVVIPITRAASIRQCRQMSLAEALVHAHVARCFAVWRAWNRIVWGA